MRAHRDDSIDSPAPSSVHYAQRGVLPLVEDGV
jgi:hypothetical protein